MIEINFVCDEHLLKVSYRMGSEIAFRRKVLSPFEIRSGSTIPKKNKRGSLQKMPARMIGHYSGYYSLLFTDYYLAIH